MKTNIQAKQPIQHQDSPRTDSHYLAPIPAMGTVTAV